MFQLLLDWTVLILRDEKQHLIFAKNESSHISLRDNLCNKKKGKKIPTSNNGIFRSRALFEQIKNTISLALCEAGKGAKETRLGKKRMLANKGGGWQRGGLRQRKERRTRRCEIFLGRAFSPLLGEITCFPVLWVPLPTAALPPPRRWPVGGASLVSLPPVIPPRIARSAILPFTPVSDEFFFLLLRPSSGRRPARLPRESAGRCFCLSCRVMPTIRSNVWDRSWTSFSRQIRCSMGAVWMYSLYASEIGLKARDFLFSRPY